MKTLLDLFLSEMAILAAKCMTMVEQLSVPLYHEFRKWTYGHSPLSAKFRQHPGGTWILGRLSTRAALSVNPDIGLAALL